MIVAGVMSGSSLDGLDVAIVRLDGEGDWSLCATYACPYNDTWVRNLKEYEKLSAVEYIAFKVDYSKYVSELLKDMLSEFNGSIDYISFHGHTLMHLPHDHITEQIGNGGILAAILGIPTITDFRIQDVQKGGVGTPLAPLVERDLFSGYDYYLNLGGIANITYVEEKVIQLAYDVCPCNQVLNHFSNTLGREYDEGGLLARSGSFLSSVIDFLQTFPFFKTPPPKALDNNWIKKDFIPGFPSGKAEDLLHTYTKWMADCIANEIHEDGNPKTLFVSGGGAHNSYFMECLQIALKDRNCDLKIPSKEIIDFKEAILMSLLAYKYVTDQVNVLCSVTGAHSDSIGGALYKVPQ
ncbi:MAG: anhydro-N-acetylmuramic acid kinase [Saprospiraceae bacterium]|nr:anhydro-N-acetylmuramic acid kinase [Saprospiraceae bacterium]